MTHSVYDAFRPPLVGGETWQRVMTDADWRCECTGGCGRTHARNEGHRCGIDHGVAHRLAVVTSEPLASLTAAVTGADLVALCQSCQVGAERLARRATEAALADPNQLDLFDLTGGDAA